MTAFIYVNRFLPVKRLMNIIRRFFSEPEALRKLNKGQSFALCVFVYSHVKIDFLLSGMKYIKRNIQILNYLNILFPVYLSVWFYPERRLITIKVLYVYEFIGFN